jgi:hypothetical protein
MRLLIADSVLSCLVNVELEGSDIIYAMYVVITTHLYLYDLQIFIFVLSGGFLDEIPLTYTCIDLVP